MLIDLVLQSWVNRGSSDTIGSSIPRSVLVENRSRGAVGSSVSKWDLGKKEENGPQ